MKKTQKGFTLVELLVVIAILAILATVSVVGYTSFIDRANQSNATTEAEQIRSIVTNALLADDVVKLSDDLYVVEGTTAGTYVVSATRPSETDYPKMFDATADVAGLVGTGLGTLAADGTDELNYTRYGFVIDVFARTAAKAPTT